MQKQSYFPNQTKRNCFYVCPSICLTSVLIWTNRIKYYWNKIPFLPQLCLYSQNKNILFFNAYFPLLVHKKILDYLKLFHLLQYEKKMVDWVFKTIYFYRPLCHYFVFLIFTTNHLFLYNTKSISLILDFSATTTLNNTLKEKCCYKRNATMSCGIFYGKLFSHAFRRFRLCYFEQ